MKVIVIISKLDRRKKYTQKVLKDSLIKLLKEKQVSSITVKEICELADINRSTFYSHYADQYDLLDKLEDELIEDMAENMSQYNYAKEEEVLLVLEKLLEYFALKQEIYQTLLNEKVDTSFQKKIMVFAHHFFIQNYKDVNNHLNDSSKYMSTFVISGSIHVMKHWLNNGMDKTPKEMAELLNNLINKGLKWD